VAWLSLDAGDNDPMRFWRYLIAACQAFQPDLGSAALALLHAAQERLFPRLTPEALLTPLLNDLARMPARSVLVLEDYHVIAEPEIHHAMRFFIEHQPATLHLVLIARAEPPLPLARLRARGELAELGPVQLRFTPEETHAFLRQALPFEIESATIDRLQERTEGWPAGLRLITLALHSQGDAPARELERRLTTIRGSQRHLLEYLVAEALSAQPEPLQTFLLQTSGLIRLTSWLCDWITGRNDSALLLEQIERANLFLIPLDGTGEWYRYHTLFAEAMQHEARRRLGEDAPRQLSSRASRWYERHGLFAEAVDAALAAEEADRAVALMTRLVESQHLLQFQELHTLVRWLAQLPEATLRGAPRLCMAYAMALLFSAEQRTPALRQRLETYLHMAENSLRAAGDLPRLGEALALHALLVEQLSDFDTALRCAQQARDLLRPGETIWWSIALGILAMEAMLAGRFAEAMQTMHAAYIAYQPIDNSYGRRGALILQGHIALGQGKLGQAEALFRQVVETAGEDRADRGTACAGLATIAYERDELEVAERCAREAYALSEDLGHELLQVLATTIFARVLYARGERTPAQELLQRLAAALTQPRWIQEIEMWLAWFAHTSGDQAAAQHWASTVRAASLEEALPEALVERAALIGARQLIAEGEAEKALEVLERWLGAARGQARKRSELEILLITARAQARLGRMTEAQGALGEALALARPAGYQRIFLDEGADLSGLLKASLPSARGNPLAGFIRGLLRGLGAAPEPPAATGALVEPLSQQEMRVLRLLVAGRTNPEIARELVVSINTIKAQVKSIYRKLDVGGRLEASDTARRLGLL
jgi:LuxR family maltose regulon positive regulatory protein